MKKNLKIERTISTKKDEPGEVYILTNPSFVKDILKIGRAKNVEERAKTLFTTGVPTPFEIFVSMKVNNYKATEKFIHRQLDEKYPTSRTYKNREFFKINQEIALEIFKMIAPLVDGKIKIYSEQDNELVIEEIEEKYSSKKFFDKVVTFDKECLEIRKELLSSQINNILFFGNLVNIFGPIDSRNRMTHNMVNNVKKIKELIKQCPNVKMHFWANKDICEYFKKVSKIIGIDKNAKFKSINTMEELIKNIKDMKFDAAILNPPYLRIGYINILEQIIKHTDRMLFVSPMSWLLNKPAKNKIMTLAQKYECSVEYIDSKKYFGRNGNGFSGVTYIDKTKEHQGIQLNELFYSSVENLIWTDGFKVLKDLKVIISQSEDNVNNHIHSSSFAKDIRLTQDKNLPCVVIPRNIGDEYTMYGRNFFCIIKPSDVKNNSVIKNFKDFSEKEKFYIPCPNIKYAENVVKFLMTDFTRVCLAYAKVSINLITNSAMRFIPWQDFNDNKLFSGTITQISNRLFKKYKVVLNKEQKQFINVMFPKVYQLEKDTYEYKG